MTNSRVKTSSARSVIQMSKSVTEKIRVTTIPLRVEVKSRVIYYQELL
jgi:hypothetical protein